MNMESLQHRDLLSYLAFYDYVSSNVVKGEKNHLISTEFSTLLSGRYVEIRLLPLSFAEFLTFYTFEPGVTMEDKFQKYLQFGGMPILKQFDFNTARVNEVLE